MSEAQKAIQDNEVVLPDTGRVAFHNVFEARPFMENGKPKGDPVYGITMLYDPADLKEAKAKAIEVAKEQFGSTDDVRFPFIKGEREQEKAAKRGRDGGFYEGKIVLKAKTKYELPVYDMNGKEMLDQKRLYSGAYARVLVKFVANEVSGQRYVSAYLQGVKKVGDGERLVGRDLGAVFGDLVDPDENLSKGGSADLDDEIPF